jgi:hypothetical protein
VVARERERVSRAAPRAQDGGAMPEPSTPRISTQRIASPPPSARRSV